MKLKLEMSIEDAILEMGEGNPGALGVLADSARKNAEIDPNSAFGAWGLLVNLDSIEVYGPRIWILHKDLCGEKLSRTTALARACQLGIVSRKRLERAIDKKESLDVEDIASKVLEHLPDFRL